MQNIDKRKNIFVLLTAHHSRAIITMISEIIKHKKSEFRYNPIFIGGSEEYKYLMNFKGFKYQKQFINFEELFLTVASHDKKNNNKKSISFSTKIIYFLKKFLKNNLKGSSIYSLILQQFIFYRLLKKSEKAKEIFKKYNPQALITISDRNQTDTSAVFLKLAKKNTIPIFLFNLTIYSKEVAHQYRQSIPELDTSINRNLYEKFSLIFLKSTIFKNILFQTREHLLAHKIFGSLSKNPWWNGNGLSDYVISSNGFDTTELIKNGVNKNKIYTLGNPEYQLIYKNFMNRYKLKRKIYENYNFDSSKKLIIASMPQWYEQGQISLKVHKREIKFYTDILRSTNFNILLSLHPRQNIKDYLYLENNVMRISKEKLSNIISCSDKYVSNISSTIIWSVLLGIPITVYNPIDLEYSSLSKLKSVKFCNTKNTFKKNIMNTDLNLKNLKKDWKLLDRSRVFQLDIISKYINLLNENCKILTKK